MGHPNSCCSMSAFKAVKTCTDLIKCVTEIVSVHFRRKSDFGLAKVRDPRFSLRAGFHIA